LTKLNTIFFWISSNNIFLVPYKFLMSILFFNNFSALTNLYYFNLQVLLGSLKLFLIFWLCLIQINLNISLAVMITILWKYV
jgi:hypothetical protein